MSKTLTAADRSALIRLASDLPVGSPERRAVLTGLAWSKTAAGNIEVVVEFQAVRAEREDEQGKLLRGKYATIRQAMDAVLLSTNRPLGSSVIDMDRKEWTLEGKHIEGDAWLRETIFPKGLPKPFGEMMMKIILTYKGKPFPKKALLKALDYLRTGRTNNDPWVLGEVLTVPGSKGDIVVTPGHPDAWRKWTVTRNGKPAHVNQGDTEDASDYHRKGFDPTDAAEASGITQIFDKETGLSSSAVQKLWSHLYRGSFRGLRLASVSTQGEIT